MEPLSKEKLDGYLIKAVKRSIARHKFNLFPGTELYLRDALLRIVSRDELFKVEITEDGDSCTLEPITFQYFDPTKKVDPQKLGDHCLILTGFFYDFIRRKGLGQIKYHAKIGKAAYGRAAFGANPEEKCLYRMLARQFFEESVILADLQIPERPLSVINDIGTQLVLNHDTKLIELYDKWLKTDDLFYFKLLEGRNVKPERFKSLKRTLQN